MTVSVIQIVIIVIAVVLMLGLITCIISHYKMGLWSWREGWGRPSFNPSEPQSLLQVNPSQNLPSLEHNYTPAPHSSILYSSDNVEEHQRREVFSQHDRQIRQQAMQMDITLGLPATITLPDGEEFPYNSLKSIHLQDYCQDNEILRTWIKPPPNRTVFEEESPPHYQSNSFILLSKPAVLQNSNITPLVIHSNRISLDFNACFPNNQCSYVQEPCNSMLHSNVRIPNMMATRDTTGGSSDSRDISSKTQSFFTASDPPPFYSDLTISQNQDLSSDTTISKV
ncbi:protein TMEPAI-like isoform X2 [Limulus polyphemus]|uniref:Protein TMEPAI-like isoform X2 n=1 Tax=Limulus polyphemus TaxID=6850 RepID=A0ABM1S8I0_LIMPO|nr:protein TMEPAI-like isoform X2 [Limulus polyphemus]